MNRFDLLGEVIINNSYNMAKKINIVLTNEFSHEEMIVSEDAEALHQWRAKLIQLIGTAIKENTNESVWAQVTEWAKTTGEGAVRRNLPMDESLKTLSSYRIVILEEIEKEVKDLTLSGNELIRINYVIDPLLDHAGYIFSTSFVDFHRRTMDLAQKAIQELSVPVVALSDEVAILPLIGEMDTYRARILKETSLKRCSELGNLYLIMDLSGVPIVDTMVANEIFQVISSLKLIGVETVLTGLRPEVAQSMVQLGISFEGTIVKNNLKSAVAYLNKK
ncbi:STAS domain-containing protein [Neobacillus sp. PS3-34]|uniref:STAS domain-containing protein n=1 Tax=Neobacillus sp. PS3-34 TaxID=3070678 RepID=UPI0027E1D92F|nr:STAS domain-containing protein [Neobacillus sp. PS3-34]WML48892.1 STAS domain-containing protein [Neobacillus sp. PS3-34]